MSDTELGEELSVLHAPVFFFHRLLAVTIRSVVCFEDPAGWIRQALCSSSNSPEKTCSGTSISFPPAELMFNMYLKRIFDLVAKRKNASITFPRIPITLMGHSDSYRNSLRINGFSRSLAGHYATPGSCIPLQNLQTRGFGFFKLTSMTYTSVIFQIK